MSMKRIPADDIAGIKQMLAEAEPHYKIMARFGVSRGLVQYYAKGAPSGHYERKIKCEPAPRFEAKPHMMPWLTVAMLTGGRAPVAKVRP